MVGSNPSSLVEPYGMFSIHSDVRDVMKAVTKEEMSSSNHKFFSFKTVTFAKYYQNKEQTSYKETRAMCFDCSKTPFHFQNRIFFSSKKRNTEVYSSLLYFTPVT